MYIVHIRNKVADYQKIYEAILYNNNNMIKCLITITSNDMQSLQLM